MGVAYKIIITALFYQDRASIFAGIEGTPPTKSMLLSSKITKKYLMSPSLQLLQKSLISDLIAKGQSCPTSSDHPLLLVAIIVIKKDGLGSFSQLKKLSPSGSWSDKESSVLERFSQLKKAQILGVS